MSSKASMPDRPLVSVIIPTFNREELVGRGIQSVLDQTGRGELFDLDVIVVDDGSTDDTASTVKSFGAPVRYRRQVNRGASAARNTGLRLAEGNFIALLDDDDCWLPHRLERQLQAMDENPDVGVVYGQGRLIGPDTEGGLWPEAAPSGWVFEEFLTTPDDVYYNLSSVLARVEALGGDMRFDEGLPTMEHYDFLLRLAFRSKFLFLEGPLLLNRFSQEGKWYQRVLDESNEQALERILARAVGRVPDKSERSRLRKQAELAMFETVADHNWWSGDPDVVWAYLLRAIEARPWLVATDPFERHFRKVRRLAIQASSTPSRAAAHLATNLRTALGENLPEYEPVVRHGYAMCLANAARAQRERGAFLQFVGTALKAGILHPTRALGSLRGRMRSFMGWP